MKPTEARWARIALRVCALMVPAHRREEWMEEWSGELEALLRHREGGRRAAYPGVTAFVAGALPHALWMRKEEWTMESVAQDLRYAARVLRRAPGFTVVAALTLALGIGVNAAIFSLVNGLMLRAPAGIEEPDRMVQIARSFDSAPRWDNWSWPAAELIRREAHLLSGVAGYSNGAFVLGRGEETEPARGQYVSGGYFDVLGVRPALGRLLSASDEVAPGAHPVVVLSHGLWMRRFGGDPGVLGSTVAIGSAPYEIVGVAPEGFVGVDALGSVPELWVPAMQRENRGRPLFDAWGSSWFYLFGRLEDGVDFTAAEASMEAVTMRLRAAWEEHGDIRVRLAQGIGLAPEERAEGRRITALLAGIAALVLLLTCANVGNLFLTRATDRGGEVSVRQALGAGRVRLARQLLTESLLLALVATAVAIPLVGGASRVLPSLFPLPMAVSVAPDLSVYLFLALVGLVAGLLFGGVPAVVASNRDVARTLREGGTTGGRSRTVLRDALVMGQLAISLGLVTGAALLGRSVLNARSASPGFNPDGVLVGFLNLRSTGRYQDDAVVDFQERLVRELEALPGVTAAALAGQAPVLGGHARSTVAPADRPDDPTVRFEAEYTVVTPGYFETLQIPLVQGRTFGDRAAEPEPVVVVNEALARRFWPGQDAVGKELVGRDRPHRVIGVVEDVQMRSLRATANPGVYYPYHQAPESYLVIHLRTQGPTDALVASMRRGLADVDADLPVTGVTDLREGLARSLAETRTFSMLVATFAGLALVLSLIGLYGLIAHGVSQRSREMGIRIALGAGAEELVRLVLSRGVALAGVGIAVGIGVSLALGQALESVLFGVSAFSPLTLGGTAVLMLAASLFAAWLPARRASRVDAAVSLRD
jgi:predicted permease